MDFEATKGDSIFRGKAMLWGFIKIDVLTQIVDTRYFEQKCSLEILRHTVSEGEKESVLLLQYRGPW